MSEEYKIPRLLVKGIIKKRTNIQVSKDVVECVCDILEDNLDELSEILSEKIVEENNIREKYGLPKIKRIDINLLKSILGRSNIGHFGFNDGDAGQYNSDTASCQTQKNRGIPNV